MGMQEMQRLHRRKLVVLMDSSGNNPVVAKRFNTCIDSQHVGNCGVNTALESRTKKDRKHDVEVCRNE